MPILNYTTTIPAERTVMEIHQVLARAGAKSINVDYDDEGLPQSVTFLVKVQENWVNFRLPSNYTGVLAALQNDPTIPRRLATVAHARRVAWRITKVWVEAQMAIIEARQAELAEVFLPYAVPNTGRTLYQDFKLGRLMLGEGN